MRLGFHYHIPAMQKEDGSIWMPGYLGVFIDGLAQEVDEVILFMHKAKEDEVALMDYALSSENISLVQLPEKVHMLLRPLLSHRYLKPIKENMGSVDVILIRGPSPLLPAIAYLCKKWNIPFGFLLVGDYVKSLQGVAMNPLKYTILNTFYKWNACRQKKLSKSALVMVNSEVLYDEYRKIAKQIALVRTTTLTQKDIYKKLNLSLHDPVELLYTGRIEPAKGLDDVLHAMKLLYNEEGIETILNVVGWEDKKGYIKALKDLAKELELNDKIIFHGKKKVGDELFTMYKNADIYVIASKGNEGFPRTIWEAMANSLPVIASRIGSIPHFLTDRENVLLIEPGNSQDIKEKVSDLFKNDTLRKDLIFHGIEMAKDNTIEKQSKYLVDMLKSFVNEGVRV